MLFFQSFFFTSSLLIWAKFRKLEKLTAQTPDEINIGAFEIQNKGCNLKINLKDKNGNPLINNIHDWGLIWFRIKNNKGKIIEDGNFSDSDIEKSVDIKSSSINIFFPMGTWTIEISLHEDKTPYKGFDKPFKFSELDCEQEMVVHKM